MVPHPIAEVWGGDFVKKEREGELLLWDKSLPLAACVTGYMFASEIGAG